MGNISAVRSEGVNARHDDTRDTTEHGTPHHTGHATTLDTTCPGGYQHNHKTVQQRQRQTRQQHSTTQHNAALHNRNTTKHDTTQNTCAARGHTKGSHTKKRLPSSTGKPSRSTPTHLERAVKASQDSFGIFEVRLSKSLHHPASSVSHEPDRFDTIPVHAKTRHRPSVKTQSGENRDAKAQQNATGTEMGARTGRPSTKRARKKKKRERNKNEKRREKKKLYQVHKKNGKTRQNTIAVAYVGIRCC